MAESPKEESKKPPLSGVRVLDLSRIGPGPYCSMLLGDFGADVLMVEAPAEGGAPGRGASQDERRRAYSATRRNKRSMVLNLRHAQGQAILHDLCRTADVVIESFRPGVTRRLRADYATLSEINARLIYCSISGYGQSGPYRDMPGHDLNYISIGGFLSAVGRPGSKPAIPLNVVGDFAGGSLFAVASIMMALYARQSSGRGQYIDIAITDAVLYLLASEVSNVLAGEEPPRPGESALTGGRPQWDVYECSDSRYVSISPIEPQFWANLCQALDCADLIPFQNIPAKFPEIRERFERIFATKTRDEWFELLGQQEACLTPVLSLIEALANESVRQRQMVVTVNDASLGPVEQVGIAPRLMETPGEIRSTAPRRGEHTDEVLRSIGRSSSEIEELRLLGVVP